MLQFQCTQKVSKLFDVTLQDLPSEPNNTVFGVWYVNYFTLLGSGFLLFVNDPTLYSVPIYISGVKSKINIEIEFKENLQYDLVTDGIREDIVMGKLAEFEQVIFTKTTSRSILGCMNDLKQNMYFYVEREISKSETIQMHTIQKLLNRIPQRTIGWNYAVEAMRESVRNV